MNGARANDSFTIEDIHAIRERCYEKTLGMTRQERIRYFNSLGSNITREMAERKAKVAKAHHIGAHNGE